MSTTARQTSAEIEALEKEQAALNRELKLDLLQSGLDVAGIFEPTPFSDLASGGISLYRGDFLGAGLSLLSCIPYAGDALGKTAKGAKLLAKIEKARKRISAIGDAINAAQKRLREYASASARAKKLAKKLGQEVDEALIQLCKKLDADLDNVYGTVLPRKGFKGARGNSAWEPDWNSARGKEIMAAQEKAGVKAGTPIEYRDGFPNFEPYSIANPKIKNMTGVDADDFRAATAEMRKTDPKWTKPDGYTWHHSEDGTTMMLVPTKINGNVAHSGGASLSPIGPY